MNMIKNTLGQLIVMSLMLFVSTLSFALSPIADDSIGGQKKIVSDLGAAKELGHLLNSLKMMQSDFYQRVTTVDGELIEEASGTFLLSKPGKFRWNYLPEEGEARGNVIVSDGEKLSMYDAELETLSARNLQEVFDQVPSLVLVADDVELGSLFSITRMNTQADLQWFDLKPTSQELSYEYMQIALRDNAIAAMKVKDAAGQLISITFDQVNVKPELGIDVFAFVAPEGTDILSQ